MAAYGVDITERTGASRFLALKSAFPWVGKTEAVFVCDGVEHRSREMISRGVVESATTKTFGPASTLRWRLAKPGLLSLRFGLELSFYPDRPWLTVQGWVENRSRSPGLDPDGRHHVFEFWSGTYLGEISGTFRTGRLKPHSCRLYAIRPVLAGEIQWVSSDLHLLQGALEITGADRRNTSPFNQARAELTLSIKPVSVRAGKITFAADCPLVLAACQGTQSEMVRREDGLWEIRLDQMADDVVLLLRSRAVAPDRQSRRVGRRNATSQNKRR